jgi:hypothetical protein
MNEIYALEWSKKQGFFHIQKLKYTIEINRNAFMLGNTLNDYHILGTGTRDEMSSLADHLRQMDIRNGQPE